MIYVSVEREFRDIAGLKNATSNGAADAALCRWQSWFLASRLARSLTKFGDGPENLRADNHIHSDLHSGNIPDGVIEGTVISDYQGSS